MFTENDPCSLFHRKILRNFMYGLPSLEEDGCEDILIQSDSIQYIFTEILRSFEYNL